MIEFDVQGQPVAEGRPRVDRRTGHLHPDPVAHEWKHTVRAACKLALISTGVDRLIPAGVPLAVEIDFAFERPASHYRTGRNAGRLRGAAPEQHTGRPDLDNLAKAVLDAVGRFDGQPRLVMVDDSQVVRLVLSKRWIPRGEMPGARVRFARAPLWALVGSPEYLAATEEPARHPEAVARDLVPGLRPAERWAVARLRSGESRLVAAERLGLPVSRLAALERGDRRGDDPAPPAVGALSLGEACFVRRRRAGLSRRDLAARLGLSMTWLGKAERGAVRGVEAVAAWWAEVDRLLS